MQLVYCKGLKVALASNLNPHFSLIHRYANQVEAKSHNREKKMAITTPRDPVDDVFLPPT